MNHKSEHRVSLQELLLKGFEELGGRFVGKIDEDTELAMIYEKGEDGKCRRVYYGEVKYVSGMFI